MQRPQAAPHGPSKALLVGLLVFAAILLLALPLLSSREQ